MPREKAKFLEVYDNYLVDLKIKNLNGIQKIYTNDVMMLPPDGLLRKGPESIVELIQEMYDEGIVRETNSNVECLLHGDYGIYFAHYTLFGDKKKVLGKGKSLFVSVKDEDTGNWKVLCGAWTKDE